MVAQANNTGTSKNTTNEKEKNNDSSTLHTLNSQYALQTCQRSSHFTYNCLHEAASTKFDDIEKCNSKTPHAKQLP